MAAAARPQSAPLTLDQAVGDSLKRYPAIRVSQEQINGRRPRLNSRVRLTCRRSMLARVNRATRNNVFGILLPQSVIPSMSGPVIGSNHLGSVWGSAIGGLVSWEPFDFGLRSANVAAANASNCALADSRKTNGIRCCRRPGGCLPHVVGCPGDRPRRTGRRRSRRNHPPYHRGASRRGTASGRRSVPRGSRTCLHAYARDPGRAGDRPHAPRSRSLPGPTPRRSLWPPPAWRRCLPISPSPVQRRGQPRVDRAECGRRTRARRAVGQQAAATRRGITPAKGKMQQGQ